MTKHKTDDYKNYAVKYYLNNENGDGYNKTCKIFGCKKALFVIGFTNIKQLKILQEKIETLFLTK